MSSLRNFHGSMDLPALLAVAFIGMLAHVALPIFVPDINGHAGLGSAGILRTSLMDLVISIVRQFITL